MKSFSPVCNSCTIMPAAAIMASRPFCSSFVCIVFSSSGSVGFSPSGSKPRSPDSKSDRISHGMPPSSPFRANRAGVLKLKTEKNFRKRDREHHRRPERLERGLLEREVSRHVDVAAEERVEVLANHEAERSEHPDTPVLQFDLAVELDLALRDVVRRAESQRVPESHRRKNSRHLLRVSLAVKLRLLSTDREHEKLVFRHQLLHDHARCRDHGEPSVLQLLRLHRLQLLRIRRLQPERIEAQVAALIVSLN